MKLKKILSGVLATATALVCMPVTDYAYADQWVEGDWEYRVTYFSEDTPFDELDVEVIKYLGKDINVVVPEKVGKHKVTGVSETFRGCADIVSITIPEGIEYINSWTFGDCTSLTSVAIPSTVNKIALGNYQIGEQNAFTWCTSLTSINVDEKN